MPMSDRDPDQAGLDAFFDAARAAQPHPTADLVARVLEDARAVQAAARSAPPRRRRTGPGEALYRLLGGWPAMAGLASAALAGVWIGAGLPDGLLGPAEASYLVDTTAELAFDLAGGDF